MKGDTVTLKDSLSAYIVSYIDDECKEIYTAQNVAKAIAAYEEAQNDKLVLEAECEELRTLAEELRAFREHFWHRYQRMYDRLHNKGVPAQFVCGNDLADLAEDLGYIATQMDEGFSIYDY
jgi:hypothetical protein